MTNKLYFRALALAFFLTGCIRETAPQAITERPEEPQVLREITPEMQAVVEFDDQMISLIEEDLDGGNFLRTKSDALNSLLMDLGVVQMERVFPYAGKYEGRTRRVGMHRFYRLIFADEVATKAVVDLGSMPGVVSAEPDRPVELRGFNDPYFSRQGHYVNTKNPDADIHLKEVWEKYTVGNSSVIVSVVDEAIDITHPDLIDNLWTDENGDHGWNFKQKGSPLKIARDDIGHGAHVAGTIAAVSNNGIGVAGVAGGDYAAGIPGVRLMSCQIFQDGICASDSRCAEAITTSANYGAVISQNSWGYSSTYSRNSTASAPRAIPNVLKRAVDYFVNFAGCDDDGIQLPDSPMKGGLVFFACGNENVGHDIISSYEPIISVGATGVDGTKASYSNYGNYVDIAAPGGDRNYNIWSTLPTSKASSGYGGAGWQGTSMACPHASGVAALLVSYFGGPGFTAEACKAYLLEGAGEVVGGNKPIGRRLDALGAFEYGIAQGGSDVPHPPVIGLEKTEVNLSSDETVTVSVMVSDPDGDEVTVTCDPGSKAVTYDSGKNLITIVGANAEDGTYKAILTATDPGGLSASAALKYTISTNHAPVIQLEKEEVEVAYEETVQIKYSVTDPDGDPVSISCSAGSKALKLDRDKGLITITGSGAVAGMYTATLVASDNGGLTTRATLTYTLLPRNQEPYIEVNPTEITIRSHESAEARVTWSDPDGDPLTITWTPGSDALSFDQATGRVAIQGNKAEAGDYKAVFMVADPDGAEAKATLFYTILENHAPIISVDQNQFTLNPLQSATAQVSWSDEDGDQLTVSCTPGSSALSFDANTGKVSIRGNKADAGAYKAVFTVTDQTGLSASTEISYTLLANHAPVVSVSPASLVLRVTESATAQVTWSDQDDWDQLSLLCDPGSDALSFDVNTGKVSIQGDKAAAGSYKARFTVTDLCGISATAELDYTIKANHAPEVAKALDNLLIKGIGQSQRVSLDGVFRDQDGESLTLVAHVTEGADVVKADISGNTLTLSSTKAGVATVELEARDAVGASCSTSFQVAVKPSDKEVDVYPVPAQDYVYFQVASPTEVPVSITFYTATGSRALQMDTTGSIFKPIQVDIASLAPGRYTAELSYDGQTYQFQIIVK